MEAHSASVITSLELVGVCTVLAVYRDVDADYASKVGAGEYEAETWT